jgi:hypothetical protein
VPARNPHVLAAIGVIPVGVCGPSDDRCDLTRRTKLIHHAIRMAAFNTAQSLARAIATGTGYARADDEAHALIRTALAGSGNIIPDHDQGALHIRLDPLPAPRRHRNFRKSNVFGTDLKPVGTTCAHQPSWFSAPG